MPSPLLIIGGEAYVEQRLVYPAANTYYAGDCPVTQAVSFYP